MIENGTYVAVYRNLHNGMFSIMCPKTRKVFAWDKNMLLKDCSFKVRRGGRLKVLKTKQKNVHAFVYGYYYNSESDSNEDLIKIKYNPYYADYFFLSENNSRIDKAPYVYFKNGSEIYAKIY